ncbi:conserved Plasmodium protein, unknown function [Plasmodium berghei]|uniref:Protein kinase domain-containing protein n=2 Tax=Plasmodium berghei TaxID=5821 RepID=A0A509AK48_PLABA|nr:conserved Plasmodium protein, unknown function [Plasmodium berghei ANKA]CXI45376.1 conserved Plasmodium protein, unknown function [Plasmodium berghei]SCM22661.1 conserved Plasmodium protein, unknown function [Plasmodium berghei]SCN25577.1 conserved Plasmodium protein, unknown function [Plasmodium berghei]SCO60528.1 conserved Plasmodium protein, unknown function [Plasmodium berghei]SCO62291.1 conserved Plasmodium protein, unknown function [Plasmodium berghei]|eukprot:XP_034421706.1 conserved Plasmodium protein, unknown function [Plasmodium berghei ANKA]
MFNDDIKNIYIKNHIKKIYIVKRHNENINTEEKKSSILYKKFDDFISILVNIRKHDNLLKKIKANINDSESSKILLDYLDFYVKNFGYKFHSFIIEYKNDSSNGDINNCYATSKLCKNDIERIIKNSYSRVLYKYDGIKYLLHYIKKHTLSFENVNPHFMKLLSKYLYVSLNPLNLLIFVYLKIYKNGTKNSMEFPEDNAKQHNDTVIIQENNTNRSDSLVEKKDIHQINNNLNGTNNYIEDSEFFCNELFSYMCSYGEYIIKRTIISCYNEIYNNHKHVRGKLKVYKWTKNYIENYIIGKLCSHYYFLNGQVNNGINKYIYNAYANNLNEYIKKYKIFTEFSSGFKNINMSNRKFSYIYELILFLYFSKKCLYHLNDNINFVYQLSLYVLYKSIKMIITYLYFNLPEYMCHYFLNIYIMFFKKKRGNMSYIMKKMKKNYRNIMIHVNKQNKSYIRAKLCNSFIKSRTSNGNIATNFSNTDGGNNNDEENGKKEINGSTNIKILEIIKTKLQRSENKRIKKALSLTYFDINSYDKRKDKIEGYQLNKFLKFHSHGSIIQLKYNNEERLRKKEREKKKNMPQKNEQEENKIITEIDKLDIKTKNQINGLIYPNKFEIIKRYSLLYNMYYKRNYGTINNPLKNISLNVNTIHKGEKEKKNENTKSKAENKNKNTNDLANDKGGVYKNKSNIIYNKKNIRSPKVANTVFKSIFGNIFKQNEHFICNINMGNISHENGQNKLDTCVDENQKNNKNEDTQKLQKHIDGPVNTDLNDSEIILNEKENMDISFPNDVIQSNDKLDETQLKDQIDNENVVINENHNEEKENELENQAIKKDRVGDELKKEDLSLDVPTKLDAIKYEIINDDEDDVILIDDVVKDDPIKTQVNTTCLNNNENIINDNNCEKEIEKDTQKESSDHIVNANNKEKHFKTVSKKNIYYVSETSSSDDSTDDEDYVIGQNRSKKKKNKRKKKNKKNGSKSAQKGKNKSSEFEKGKEKEDETNHRRSKRLMNTSKCAYYISYTSKESKLSNSNRSSKMGESTIKVREKKEKDVKETDKYVKKTNELKESNENDQELKEKEKIVNTEKLSENKFETSNKSSDINDEENNKDDERKNIIEFNCIFSHDNNDIESSNKNIMDSTNIEEDNDEKGETKDTEKNTKENIDGDEKNKNSLKIKNSKNLIFDLSLSDSEHDILLVDTRSNKKKDQNFYEIKETNISISDDENVNNNKNSPVKVNDYLVVNKNNIKICNDDNDIDMKRRKTEYIRLQGDYDIINEKNIEIYRESKEQENPFLDTCEAYINEKVEDNKKIEVQTDVKLIVIYLFNHFIVGAINLINPYNIAEKERYNYFTQIQSNINDINHTQIYKYNYNSNHSSNTIFTNFEIQGTLKKNTEIHLLSIKNEKRVLTILTKHGKGINGCIYKCLVNGKLMACKIQKKLYLAKKEIYFSYILKTRRSNKLMKYAKQNTLIRHNKNDGNKNIFYEVLKEHEIRYIFPDELHYKVVDIQKGNSKYTKLLQSYYRTNNNEVNDIEVGNSLLLMNTFKNVKTVNDIINYFIKKNYNAINEEFILFIVYQMVVAVLQLHLLDVVHGDIKIDNILVSKDDNPKSEGKDNEANESKFKEINSMRNKTGPKKETTHSDKFDSKSSYNNEGKIKKKKNKSTEFSQINAGKIIDCFLNSELNKDSDKSFLKKKFPVNLFLVDIGRGIDMKNFKKYLFYGDKYCDCYNFLTDSIFTYHIDFIGIAQVASCLLFYKHIGNTKYKYENKIEDKTTISVNNFDITYMTHNSHFLKTNINRNNDYATKISKSRYKELENFIKIKEKMYKENNQLNDKNKSTILLHNSFKYDATLGTKLREKNYISNSAIKRKRSSNENENIANKKINCENDNCKKQNCKDNNLKKKDQNNVENLDDIYFMDYFRIFPIDKKINEKISSYFNQIKKQGDSYFVEKAEKKIKSFYVKLLLNKKKYAHFWEIFFHVLLNFCNVYELDNIKYNSNDINSINEEINIISNKKIINKENNYYFDFEKKNWNEIDYKKDKSFDTFNHDKSKKYENLGSDNIMISQDNEGIKNKLNKNTKLFNLNANKINNTIDICTKDTASNNGNSDVKSSFCNIINNTEGKNKIKNNSHDFHDNTKDNIYSDKAPNTSKNNPLNERNKKLSDKNNKVGLNQNVINNDGIKSKKNDGNNNNITDLKKENKNNNSTTTNNKYFFIKNSISNLKVIKKTAHNNKNNIEKNNTINELQNKVYNSIGKDIANNKRKFYFFENEQNKRKCRKLNDKKLYHNQRNNIDTKKSTRYINKLLKKKAIITLVTIKKTIENIFENIESQDILHKELDFISTII